jgi:AcrR family transcriptional regulator
MPSERSCRPRARILDRALELFEHGGYDDTSTAQIADAAGVTPMTFFRHFPTKASAGIVGEPWSRSRWFEIVRPLR